MQKTTAPGSVMWWGLKKVLSKDCLKFFKKIKTDLKIFKTLYVQIDLLLQEDELLVRAELETVLRRKLFLEDCRNEDPSIPKVIENN